MSKLTKEQMKFMEPVSQVEEAFCDLVNEHPDWDPNAVCTATSALLASILGNNALSEESLEVMIEHVAEFLKKKSYQIFRARTDIE